ncbi:hypothetical protein UFOVP13_23 [uncultured Caudovirales phage]|uniref:Uncharacterized protein n=1 Tax=uncultured Caudovirales phage TaxID=2100421 RepID=A0A6J5KJH4_9CAUD|nr:hypothetical protein UFOVP13_23 [uncultured Caudovirales phage]
MSPNEALAFSAIVIVGIIVVVIILIGSDR